MVCTANDLLELKEFPKGLKVLLLDEDCDSAAETRSKLEEMDYVVSTFFNQNEALSEISNKPVNFHIAMVEVNTSNSSRIFEFLGTVKELPIIVISNIHCLNTMMKCIALGAVEFLQKPLSEDKLRNIWQHVLHKAFSANGTVKPESLEPIKVSNVSILQLPKENGELRNQIPVEEKSVSKVPEDSFEQSAGSDKYPGPSTPQLKQNVRSLLDGDCQEQTNCSSEKALGDQDGECKSVETTCATSVAEAAIHESVDQEYGEFLIKKETDSLHIPRSDNTSSLHQQKKGIVGDFGGEATNSTKVSATQNRSGSRANRKKFKVDWTPDLHKKFVQAVEQLGVDQAVPSRILELMKVDGLTRHNVASHLQKFRMHRRHILPKEDNGRCPLPRDPLQRVYYPQKPIVAYPPYHSPCSLPTGQVYPVWGQPSIYPSGYQLWGSQGYPAWQTAESWHWNNPLPGMHADAWGCPALPTPHIPYSTFPQNVSGIHNCSRVDNSWVMPQNSCDLHPAEDVVDKVVRETISKPWLPLPLGLKPPSTDIVLAELSKQGISTVPPRFIDGSNAH